jgi:S-adenosyl-L-methionine hydrolase (adenosine-forming)
MPRVTLLTDFGTRDGYVGAMKGVISSIFPGVTLDDVSHEVEPGDIAGAALSLGRYWKRYPGGTVHLVVVDPGVGTDRRVVALEADRRFLVAPDNGVLTRVLDSASSWRAVEITNPGYLLADRSRTFHGRDVMAPAAAYLARGIHLQRLGDPVDDLVRVPEPVPVRKEEELLGEVVALDRFGNLITNLPEAWLDGAETVEIVGRSVPLRQTYGEVPSGEPVAVVNSDARLEVAARDGSAARLLGAEVGTPVRVSRS